jgi:hypothetical protein
LILPSRPLFHAPSHLDPCGSDPRFPNNDALADPVRMTLVLGSPQKRCFVFQPHHHAITMFYRPDIMMRIDALLLPLRRNEHQPK